MVELGIRVPDSVGYGKVNTQANNSLGTHSKAVLSRRKHCSQQFFHPRGQVTVWTAGLQLSAWLWKILPPTQ